MAAVAVETSPRVEARLRAVPTRPAAVWPPPTGARGPSIQGDIEPWELHSELVLVSPEIRTRALELLPERDPDAFLAKPQVPVVLPAGTVDEAQHTTSLPVAVAGYALWRLIETARTALVAVGGVVALALLAEVLH